MNYFRFLFALFFAVLGAAHAQVATLDNFNNPGASGAVLSGTSWVSQVTRNTGTITVGGTARDDSGWGASGLTTAINGSSMTHVTVIAQRDDGNVAPFLVVALEDTQLRTHTVSVSTSQFALGTLTTVNIPIGAWQGSFNPTQISGWSLGGGTPPLGTNAFRMTFDHLSLTGGQPPAPPTITAEPADRAIGIGTGTTFTVAANANNSGTLRYQWFREGSPLSGQTQATLSLATLTLEQAGLYRVNVTNDAGTTPSRDARLTVFDARPTHALASGTPGYVSGGTVTITNTLAYAGTATALRWNVILPTGWSFASATNTTTASKQPPVGTPTDLEWEWSSVPASPFTFTYTLNVPIGTAGDRTITALSTFTQNAVTGQILAKSDPLVVRNALESHTADRDGDRRISLAELTRVIELFNTRNGTTRTGAYDVDTTEATEDGFVTAPTRAAGPFALSKYHSADWNGGRDGRIDLDELLRVIQLYNFREGTVRTGAYRVDATGDDGFAPGS